METQFDEMQFEQELQLLERLYERADAWTVIVMVPAVVLMVVLYLRWETYVARKEGRTPIQCVAIKRVRGAVSRYSRRRPRRRSSRSSTPRTRIRG